MLKTKKLRDHARLPERSHEGDAGLDLYAAEDVEINNDLLLIPTGIAIELPFGTVGLILDRSSMATKGFHVYGGVVDSNYRGEIKVIVSRSVSDINGTYYCDPFDKTATDYPSIIKAGTKIAQLVIVPILLPDIYEVSELSESDRGNNGFGSTGV